MMIRGKAFSLGFAAVIAAGAALWAPALSAQTAQTTREPLRVCADPDNLPFTRAEGAERGLYIELAELVGAKLDMPVQYTWYFTHMQRRALRNTILQGECDAVFALPADAEYRARGVQKTKPFLDVGYALVAAPGFSANSLEALKGKRIALQFSSTPHIFFSTLTGYTTATYRSPAEIFEALAKGEVDVGIVWGPVAGYENKTLYQSRWQVTPLTGHDMSGQVVVGVRVVKEGLKARIDQALSELQPEIRALAGKYSFPTAVPVNLESKPGSAARELRQLFAVRVPVSGWVTVADETKPAAKPAAAASGAKAAARKPAPKASAAAASLAAAAPAVAAAAAVAVLDPEVLAGKVRFNDQCSHCHGSDGFSPALERDLRRLKLRYDAKWQETALTTIRNGRPDAGMPTWKDVLGEKEINQVLGFLGTIQK